MGYFQMVNRPLRGKYLACDLVVSNRIAKLVQNAYRKNSLSR